MFEITVYRSHLLRKCIGPIPEMATDRKIFDFLPCRGIMAEIEYPGIAKLVSRLVWDQETVRSSRTTRTKSPLKSTISEGFFLFFVYCGADCIVSEALI